MVQKDKIAQSLSENLLEGVVVIDFDGTIIFANPASFSILDVEESEMIGSKFATIFFNDPENDGFAQLVLDAAYDKNQPHQSVIAFQTEKKKKHLRVVTSFFRDPNGKPAGIMILISDLSVVVELEDSVKAMERINELNRQLNARNEILSKTFGQFLSDDIVKELLDSPDGLVPGGRKRFVSIMMSDLRGFTAMSERMDPDDLISMLNHYLEAMTDIIQARKGTIIEFIGDGIMAVFGAPVSSDTHAANAVAAALEMEKAMDKVNLWNAERGYPRLEMGIGLDSGEVIVGNIGSEKRMKYGVVGSHVNLCGRIESYTAGGQVLISPNVREQISSPLTIEKEMTVLPKGAKEEIVLSHVTGIGAPYNVKITVTKNAPKPIPEPIPICFFRIDEKHTMEQVFYGGITAVGRDCALMETESELALFDNLQLKAGGRLLCKVMEKAETGYFLQYTSIPSGYDAWLKMALRQ